MATRRLMSSTQLQRATKVRPHWRGKKTCASAQDRRVPRPVPATDLPSLKDSPPEAFSMATTARGGSFEVSREVMQSWHHNGYIVVRSLLCPEELARIKDTLENSSAITANAFEVDDGAQRKSKLCLWNQPGRDVTGQLVRTEKVAGTAAQLLGGEVYHYHTKLMMKSEFTGGRFAWHQDYGYWYKNCIPFPQMLTAFVAIDRCSTENGCMQVLRGSHHAGRIDHVMVGGQTGADMERVAFLQQELPEDHVALAPGDCLFFHCNLLHKSNANTSPHRRWAFLCAYNRASNNPHQEHHHPFYTPLETVSNSALLSCTTATDMGDKDFLDPADDRTAIAAR